MSRFNPRRSDRASRHSFHRQVWRLPSIAALALLPMLNTPAQAASVTATLQVRARVVSSCRVTTDGFQSAPNTTRGIFTCPTNSTAPTPFSAAARDASANYTLSDAPDTDGAVKILTINF